MVVLPVPLGPVTQKALSDANLQRKSGEQRLAVEADGQIVAAQDFRFARSACVARLEGDLRGLLFANGLGDQLAVGQLPIQSGAAALGLLTALAGEVLGDVGPLLGDERLVLLELPFLGQRPAGFRLGVVGVVAGKARRLPPFDLDDSLAEPIEQVAIVRDHHRPALVGGEELLQPADRVDVEVVGRLVEQQQRLVFQQQLGECGPAALSAGKNAGGAIVVLLGEAQSAEDLGEPGLEGVPAGSDELGVHPIVGG